MPTHKLIPYSGLSSQYYAEKYIYTEILYIYPPIQYPIL